MAKAATAAGWALLQGVIGPSLPALLRPLIMPAIRKSLLKQLDGQGTGRFPAEEVWQRGLADLKAIERQLGHKPFLFGDRPSSADASAFGVLANLAKAPQVTPLKQALDSSKALTDYLRRCEDWRP